MVSKRKQSWEIIKKARRMWPPSLDDILQLYDEAENLDPDYHLIFQIDYKIVFRVPKICEQLYCRKYIQIRQS